jgi:hypothetical protein
MDKVQIYRGRRGVFSRTQWRARVVDAGNHEKLFQSSEGYNNLGDLMRIVTRLFPDLAIEVENDLRDSGDIR